MSIELSWRPMIIIHPLDGKKEIVESGRIDTLMLRMEVLSDKKYK
jgi:hypothetical protein